MMGFAIRRLGIAAAIGCALTGGGCAPPQEHVFTAGERAPVRGTSQVDMLVATTRMPSAVPGEMFGGNRGEPGFAQIAISIPPDHKTGQVEWPRQVPADPERSFAIVNDNTLSRHSILAKFQNRLEKGPTRNVLVFVHGFNNTFEDAVFRFAQIVHDSGTDDVPVLFTWPSAGKLLAYGYDRDSSTYSRDALERTLDYLIADKSVGGISILAHSMGNWVTLEALRQMAIRNRSISPKIRNVMLADADVDIDVFRTQVNAMGASRPAFTVFIDSDDKALAVAKILWGSKARLGDFNPNAEPYKAFMEQNRISIVNMTDIRTNGWIDHGVYAHSPRIIQQIGQQLASSKALTDQRISPIDSLNLATVGVVSQLTGLNADTPR
ncbi:esterase/lipase superfamily enzyme [Kaistia hirudinis]|uniref:Esterase/lipase superfamily enzyme n=1 Tax=Kaistia hirudinis TaxID=1293440 RepID=A0A840AX47_9HYPH|nr:alpha/beta hydrolase [Kaistia hirudinis]MBB3933728.1 esterase/lipase superfamily enzyme [Kaistia hirudinis]